MVKSDHYTNQVRLLVALLPIVAKQSCFALNGGTAINLFVRDMPRLSVDIDLAYLPVSDRGTSLSAIDQTLATIAIEVDEQLLAYLVSHNRPMAELLAPQIQDYNLGTIWNPAYLKC